MLRTRSAESGCRPPANPWRRTVRPMSSADPERPPRHVAPRLELAVSVVAAGAAYAALGRDDGGPLGGFFDGRRQEIYAAVLGLHSSLLGFALATLTVVMGYAQ